MLAFTNCRNRQQCASHSDLFEVAHEFGSGCITYAEQHQYLARVQRPVARACSRHPSTIKGPFNGAALSCIQQLIHSSPCTLMSRWLHSRVVHSRLILFRPLHDYEEVSAMMGEAERRGWLDNSPDHKRVRLSKKQHLRPLGDLLQLFLEESDPR
jgi:hypothetical protein